MYLRASDCIALQHSVALYRVKRNAEKTGCQGHSICVLCCVQLRIRDIRVPRRIRKRKIQIDDLIESMAEFGLLQPVLVDADNTLIAGYRRLEAARALGWDVIDVRVIEITDRKDRLLLEIEENTVRQDFDQEELERARSMLQRDTALWRLWHWLVGIVEDTFKRTGY